jgi:dolichol-phosphate mannosyltransferase
VSTSVESTISVVIPTYNERANLPGVIQAVLELVPAARIIVVDDGSPDGTGAIADELANSTGRVEVIHRTSKDGIGPAYIAGFTRALALQSALIVTMDADGSHAPADLVTMMAATDNADLVVGSRYIKGGSTVGWPKSRQLLSRMGGRSARLVLRAPVNDLTSGFKIYRREALSALPLDNLKSDGYSFQIETTWRTWTRGLRVREVPITFHDRVAGKSKLSRRIVVEAVFVVWRLRFERGQSASEL